MIVRVLAHAKINLYLDILGKQNGGYHDIVSVTQSVGLADEIKFWPGSEISVVSNCAIRPEENLVKRTAEIFREEFGVRDGATIELEKSIPIAAGLGGGSADAAATLIGLNKIWALGLSRRALAKIGERIGADVPLCMLGGTLLVRGKGEKLTVLPDLPQAHVVIAKPPLEILTKNAYASFDLEKTRSLSSHQGIFEALKKQNLKEVGKNLANVFEKVFLKKFPEINRLKKVALEAGAVGALMSGSGPSVFALADSESQAEKIFKALKQVCHRVILTKNHPRGVTEVSAQNRKH